MGIAGLALAGCGPSGPPPVTYVLGTPAPATASAEPLIGRPVVEVKPVLVPDYLDVSDLLVRQSENAMVPSQTGRWGERLSVGMTRALALELAGRLPGFVVSTNVSAERPVRQVVADVETFQPRSNRSVVLVVRWRVLDGAGRNTLAGERVSLTEQVGGSGDAAAAAAMTRAITDLAQRIAAGIRGTLRTTRAAVARRGD